MDLGIQKLQYSGDDFSTMVSFDNGFFINATEIYKAAGKPEATFNSFKNRTLIPRAQRLIEMGAIPPMQNAEVEDNQVVTVDDLIIVRNGGNQGNGTWIHPKLRMVFTRWISEDFDIWCDMKVEELFTKGYTGLNTEITNEITKSLAYRPTLMGAVAKLKKKRNLHIMKFIVDGIQYALEDGVPFDDVLRDIMAATDYNSKELVYGKVLKCLDIALMKNLVTIGQYTDMKNSTEIAHKALLRRRITVKDKQIGELNTEISSLKVKAIGPQDDEEKTELKNANDLLERKLKLYQDAENTPVIDLTKITITNAVSEAGRIKNYFLANPDKGTTIIAKCIDHNSLGGKPGKNGGTIPDYSGKEDVFSMGLWWKPSRNTYWYRLTKAGMDKQSVVETFLEVNQKTDSLYTACYFDAFNRCHYIAFEQATQVFIDYFVQQ